MLYLHRPCLIKCIGCPKQHVLQLNGHAWFHLQGLRRAVRKEKQVKNMSPASFKPATFCTKAGALDRSTTPTGVKNCLKSYKIIAYTETKKFSNSLQIRIFITEIHVEITTNLIWFFFCSKCNYNLIQYQILQNFICMERSACHNMFFKRTKCQYFEHYQCASETVSDSFGGHTRTRDSS